MVLSIVLAVLLKLELLAVGQLEPEQIPDSLSTLLAEHCQAAQFVFTE
jgi:hypothetical protein